MESFATVAIHSSQFPDVVRRELVGSLERREINHKFHYESMKQAQKWLAVYRAYSPFITDADCRSIYDAAFLEASAQLRLESHLDLLGLGCGSGEKDIRLMAMLRSRASAMRYVPCDVSVPLVLAARTLAVESMQGIDCVPVVCDLAAAGDLTAMLDDVAPKRGGRIITFFGMVPNFEPATIFPRLSQLVAGNNLLLLSANLAPGPNYTAGVQQVLPLYDNAQTREWLLTFLLDLGVERTDGECSFRIEDDLSANGLKRIAAYFKFSVDRAVELGGERVELRRGETVRLFFSYRYTPAQIRQILAQHGLKTVGEWIASSQEEGVFLCRREIGS